MLDFACRDEYVADRNDAGFAPDGTRKTLSNVFTVGPYIPAALIPQVTIHLGGGGNLSAQSVPTAPDEAPAKRPTGRRKRGGCGCGGKRRANRQ